MKGRNIFFNNNDLVFYLSDYLDDKSSFRLFNCNKYLNNINLIKIIIKSLRVSRKPKILF